MNVIDRARRPPLSPKEGWMSDGRQVLHFKPLRYDLWSQALEVTLGELIPGEHAPLLQAKPSVQRQRSRGLTREQAIKLCVAVRDQGPGIAECEQGRIFERFYRRDSSRSRQSGGTGLGLPIAQAIARRYRGRITLRSTLGAGSTFLLQLPALA